MKDGNGRGSSSGDIACGSCLQNLVVEHWSGYRSRMKHAGLPMTGAKSNLTMAFYSRASKVLSTLRKGRCISESKSDGSN